MHCRRDVWEAQLLSASPAVACERRRTARTFHQYSALSFTGAKRPVRGGRSVERKFCAPELCPAAADCTMSSTSIASVTA